MNHPRKATRLARQEGPKTGGIGHVKMEQVGLKLIQHPIEPKWKSRTERGIEQTPKHRDPPNPHASLLAIRRKPPPRMVVDQRRDAKPRLNLGREQIRHEGFDPPVERRPVLPYMKHPHELDEPCRNGPRPFSSRRADAIKRAATPPRIT